jgi:hypothetical protein
VTSPGALPPLTQPGLDRAGRPGVTTHTRAATDPIVPASSSAPAVDRYRHGDMVRYASAWALGRNPNHPDHHHAGGDSTSFVSQIMLAGGWEPAGPPRDDAWFPGPTIEECGRAWGVADDFHTFAIARSGRFAAVENVLHCRVSDVVQYDWTGDGPPDHTQFVSGTAGEDLYLTQHDIDCTDRPITEILADVRRTYPNVRTYGMTHRAR